MRLVSVRSVLGLFCLLSGCAVNRAVVDPFAYAPEESCWYWSPDCKAQNLSCELPKHTCARPPSPDHKLSLAEVIDIALVNNPKTQISWAEARLAAAEYGRSQSTFFPNISADFYLESDRTAYLASQVEQPQNVARQTLLISNQSYYGPQAHLTWTLFDFGVRRYTSEAARFALYYADYFHNDSLQRVVEEVTIDYYQYLYQVKLQQANEADLANAQETLAAADLGLKQGTKNLSDVLQARTQVLLAEITLSEQRKAVKKAYTSLLEQMGLAANSAISFEALPFVDPEQLDLGSLEGFVQSAAECRPDLLAIRAALRSAEMELKAAKRLWTPTLDYSLDIGRTYFKGGFHDDYDYSSVLTLSMPLFTGFNIRNTVRKARARVEAAEGELRERELRVLQEVTTAHFNVQVAFDTLHAATRYFTTTQQEYTVALAQYREGVNTILDVISAQSSLFDARAKQAQAVEQWFNSLATLTYSSGVLFGGVKCID